MSNEFLRGTDFSDTTSPGNQVNAARLQGLVDNGKLLIGAIANKSDVGANATDVADMILLQDVSDSGATEPKKVSLANALPQEVRQGKQQYAAGTLSGGVYAVTLSPVTTIYNAGMVVRFKADSSNSGAVDINVNGAGAKNLFTRAGAELAANDIVANQIVEAVYDGTNFYVINTISAAQITAAHITETLRESVPQYAADGGTANTYAVTLSPAATAYTAGMVVRFKAANANTGASTLNVNGVGAINLKKSNGGALQANDIVANQLVEAVYDGTNFQIGPGRSWDFVGTGSVPSGSAATAVSHGLGAKPSKWKVVLLQNTGTAQQGYAQNDEVQIENTSNSNNGNMVFTASVDASNVTVARVNSGNVQVVPKTGGGVTAITDANWLIKVYASL